MQATQKENDIQILSVSRSAIPPAAHEVRIGDSMIPAGFPSPADDFHETFDIVSHIVKHPAATFFMRVAGDSMDGAGIFDGDLVIVDRSLEALLESTKIIRSELRLDHEIQYQNYKVFIMPGSEVISLAALEKIEAFYNAGGKIIATTQLPSKSAELRKDDEVQTIIAKMFGTEHGGDIKFNENGGCAVFLGSRWRELLESTLDKVLTVYNVWIDSDVKTVNGNFSYMHKQNDGVDVYYFANSSDTAIDTKIIIRKRFTKPMIWDPHDGTRRAPEFAVITLPRGEMVTEIRLQLPAAHSVFVVDEDKAWNCTGRIAGG